MSQILNAESRNLKPYHLILCSPQAKNGFSISK